MSNPAPKDATDTALDGGFRIRRNAARGFAVGAVAAAAVFVVFVMLPGTGRATGLYVGLAFVLGASVGLLVTIVLVAQRARRLARTL